MEQDYGREDQLRSIAQHAQTAMAMMTKAGVPMTPENYTVFFAYAENRLPQLNVFIDELLAKGRALTPELCTAVHRWFLNTALRLEAVRETNERLGRMLHAVSHDVGEACQITEGFGFVLREHGGTDARHGRAERAALAVEVDRVVEQLGAIQSRLLRSEREVTELKGRLAEAERDATVDPLTGLANRRRFDRQFATMATACRRDRRALSVLMADVDSFKVFNDQHGHGLGDQVLRLVGNVILDNVRPGDVAARYGGDEFAVLLPDATASEASAVARRISETLATRPFVVRQSRRLLGHVTLSVGVAQLRPNESAASVLHRADRALYLAKRNGRNRVCSDEEASPRPARGA